LGLTVVEICGLELILILNPLPNVLSLFALKPVSLDILILGTLHQTFKLNIQATPQVLSYVSMKQMLNIRHRQHQLHTLSSGKNYALGFNLFVLENFG
jgi:hypothetical protein